MTLRPTKILRRAARRYAAEQWAHLAATAERMSPNRLSDLSEEARKLRGELDKFLRRADKRARQSRADLRALPLPPGTDWRWRPNILMGRNAPSGMASPQSGERFGGAVVAWHDCPHRALALRQVQSRHATDLTAFALRMEVYGFSGSYLSVSVDLPHDALEGLTKNMIVRLETLIEIERPIEIYARLNVQNGPNTEKILRHLGGMSPDHPNLHVTEFDLFTTQMNEKRLEKIWVDLIFEAPSMNAVDIRELILSRHPRANV